MNRKKLEFVGWCSRAYRHFRRCATHWATCGLLAGAAVSTPACQRVAPAQDVCEMDENTDNPYCEDPPTPTDPTPADCESTGGTCVHEPPDGWFGPNLYWIGPPDENPGCPPEAILPGATLHADLGPVDHACPSCDCGPSETTCLPSTNWTLAAAKCADADSATQTPFDVLSPDWTGTCNQDNAVPQNALCDGAPCVQSVTVVAPQALSAPCAPATTGQEYRPGPPWPWAKLAQECLVTPSDTCTAGESMEGRTCIPTPGDYLACISLDHGDHQGDIDCPSPFYDEKHTLYRTVADTRACAQCTCGAPKGAECAVQASVHGDAACSDILGLVVVFSGDRQACFDVSSGVALGSKTAQLKLTTEGTCTPSGGEPTGTVAPTDRVTLCCHHEVSK